MIGWSNTLGRTAQAPGLLYGGGRREEARRRGQKLDDSQWGWPMRARSTNGRTRQVLPRPVHRAPALAAPAARLQAGGRGRDCHCHRDTCDAGILFFRLHQGSLSDAGWFYVLGTLFSQKPRRQAGHTSSSEFASVYYCWKCAPALGPRSSQSCIVRLELAAYRPLKGAFCVLCPEVLLPGNRAVALGGNRIEGRAG